MRGRIGLKGWAIAVGCLATVSASNAQIPTGSAQPSGSTSTTISSASADYRIGPGDLLTISVYRSPDLQMSVRVATDGTIGFASLGDIHVADLTASEVAAKLAGELKRRGILVAPSVNVLVADVRAKTVLVMGAVERAGEIPLDRPGITLAGVLARTGAAFGTGSGIVTVMASKDEQGPREQFRIGDLISGAKDREARPGEILVVQAAPLVYVSGEVGRSGAFPLESGMTVGQALALGGGITPRGSKGRIQLTRKRPDGSTQIIKNVKLDTAVMPDDLVYVRPRIF